MLLVNLMQSQGRSELVEETFREHSRRGRRPDDNDEDNDEKVDQGKPVQLPRIRGNVMTLGEKLRLKMMTLN